MMRTTTKQIGLTGLFIYWLTLLTPLTTQAQLSPVRDTVLTARSRTALTNLYYGTGTDRLGGAKRETLDSGIVLHITGITDKLYRVQLAPNQTAYVPSEQVRVDSVPRLSDTTNVPAASRQLVEPPTLLTGNWTVSGDSLYDYIAIRLPERLPYQSRQEIAPDRIILDIFGAAINTNWITQLRTVQTVERVWFEQVADAHIRIFVALRTPKRGPAHWGYSLYYQKTTLMLRLRRPPAGRRLRGMTIAVDAGHGGSNTGAKGEKSGQLEKNLTLDVARRLATYLERAGARVIMLRTTDTTLGTVERVMAMRKLMPNLLVSVHFNSSGSAKVRGVSTYYKHVGFRPWSQAVLAELLQRLPVSEFGNVGHFNFFFNSPTDYPNLLVEGPFLSNPDDEALIIDPAFRDKMAKTIAKGLRRLR
ncbi:N-acetylmuramoyl-L-alanine amidase family protein [Fibrella forsythiae]|uniref:N-acetylmuramoyl-L-alanine amidase n=1 Tax=Fibrella forsythiae TaxID=2817061 RepID=A0ABS3JHV1_9BACT|nr:N-acetylmuramoyl-L-alanine amidase [Fibrella forsythiae]MBO0948824.1 N-acetylmuramoyl-L-alanine amidase [Fibrella forsythiae]